MDIQKLREETAGVKFHTHFNNAGASLIPSSVRRAVIDYLDYEELHGGYETAERFHKEIEGIYTSIGKFINADAEEIALLENATAAWIMAFLSIDLKAGDIILTSKQEYASNYLAFLRIQKEKDVKIEVIDSTESGEIDLAKLKEAIKPKTRLIAISHMPTNSGLVQPAEEIGKIATEYNVLYLLDACQSIGHYPLDVKKLKCDFLSATGRKYLRAPRGTGFLYVKKEVLQKTEPYIIDLHSATWIDNNTYETISSAKKFENWESNIANQLGLKSAAEYAFEIGIESIWTRVKSLGDYFRNELEKIESATVTDIGSVKSGIVTFKHNFIETLDLKKKLFDEGISTSNTVESGTLIDMRERGLDKLIRASVHYYNTEEEIDRCCDFLKSLKL
ncbi:MAG: aminotransferase class V-fold PLP-dependent enzyme [Bacteroidota bacterium]